MTKGKTAQILSFATAFGFLGCARSTDVQSKPLGTVSSSGFSGPLILTPKILNAALKTVQSSALMKLKGIVEAKIGSCDPFWLHNEIEKEVQDSQYESATSEATVGVVLIFDEQAALAEFVSLSLNLLENKTPKRLSPMVDVKFMDKDGLEQNVGVLVCGIALN